VEVAMQEAVLNYVRVPMMGTYLTHKPTPRVGNRLGAGPIGDIFKCAPGGPNDYVYLYCANPDMWRSMWNAIGKPEVADDPRFSDRKERRKYIEELTQLVESWTSQRTKQEVMKIMGEAEVPCGAVLDSVELLSDPHLRERGMIVTVEHPVRGEFTMPGCPVRLDDSPVEVESAPLLGQHNHEIYSRMLHFSDEDLQRLKQEGII
ncbi:MAG: CoA transferase, partial [Bryobacterales bacterium]|nr:CoA transferase [Bryobacterales bacterium]